MTDNLATEIREYIAHAKQLQQEKDTLVAKIQAVVDGEIAPAIRPLLPPEYTINLEETSINTDEQGIWIALKLFYRGERIFPYSPGDVPTVQKLTQPALAQFEKKYNIWTIFVDGEPGEG